MAVTVQTGKTHSRYARIMIGGSDLSGDARSLGAAGINRRPSPASGWEADLNENLIGRGTIMFGPFAALFNSDDRRSFYAIGNDPVEHATLFLGIRQAPQIGCPAFSANVQSSSSAVNVSDDAPVMIDGDFSGAQDGDAGWGEALAVGVDYGTSASLGSLNNGAATTGGYLATLHLVSPASTASGNSWSIEIQHSTNDSAWSVLDTFTLDGTAASSQMLSGTASVNQYTRVVLDKAAGNNIKPWVALIRK